MTHKLIKTENYLLVVDDSLTVGKGYALNTSYKLLLKYDTDQHLAYFNDIVKKIIAHLPLNGSPILEGVDLLPPYSRHQEDGVKELAELKYPVIMRPNGRTLAGRHYDVDVNYSERSAYKYGYNKAREKYKYTEEDMRKAIDMATTSKHDSTLIFFNAEEIIQSLHQYPTEFETEDVLTPSQIFYPNDVPYCSPKTITTTQGIQWVGKYK